MSNLPSIIETDISDSEMNKVRLYIEHGMPGLVDIKESQIYQMIDLYLSGSTYTQIANTLELKKVTVMYLAQSQNWYMMKQEYLNEIQEKIKNRVVDSKLRSQEFMLTLVQAWQKKVGKQLTKYLSTNDPQHMEDLDLKEIAQLMKAIEIVNDLDNTGKSPGGKPPAIGLNLGSEGVTVEKTGHNTISITPKEKSVGDILKQYADSNREKEKTESVRLDKIKSDIVSDNKGE